MKEKIKAFFRLNGKVTNEQRILNDFQKNRNKDILISILQALIMILLCAILVSIHSIVLHAEEITEIGGDLIAREDYHYKTYDRVTTWHLDLESGKMLDHVIFSHECSSGTVGDSDYYTYDYHYPVLIFNDSTASGTIYRTVITTYTDGSTKIEDYTIDIGTFLETVTCDSGNGYTYLCYGGMTDNYSNATEYYNVFVFNNATYIDTTESELRGSNSSSMWLEYFNLYDTNNTVNIVNYSQTVDVDFVDDNIQDGSTNWNYVLQGDGKFVLKTYVRKNSDGTMEVNPVFFSDKPFTYNVSNSSSSGTDSALLYGNYYYIGSFGMSYVYKVKSYNFRNYTGELVVYENDLYTDEYAKYEMDNNLIDLSSDDYEQSEPTTPTYTYNADIPTPNITIASDTMNIGFNNNANDYYIEVRGRWYSVDDIELYKENLLWKYKYSTEIKGTLTNWLTMNDKVHSGTQGLSVDTIGRDAFDSFLALHPIDNRTYIGGTNTLGNFISGYNEALGQIKSFLLIPSSLYNSYELYCRYYIVDENGNFQYGKWCHYFNGKASAQGSTGTVVDNDRVQDGISNDGLTDEEFTDVESMLDSRLDVDIYYENTTNNSNDKILGFLDMSNLIENLKRFIEQSQTVLNMFGQVFSFLPPWVTNFMIATLVITCAIAIFKALGK